MHAGPNMLEAGHRLKGAAVVDTMATSLSAAYSFRKVRSAYAGPSMRLWRADLTQQDIGFTASGDFDTAAAFAFCTGSAWCVANTIYDQSGNARHVANPNGPPYNAAILFNCVGDKPCLNGGTQSINTAASFTPSGPQSYSSVSRADAVAVNCTLTYAASHGVIVNSGQPQSWLLWNGSTGLFAPAALGGWHAAEAVVNGASTVFAIDGVDTTGTLAVSATPGPVQLVNMNDGGKFCSWTEGIWWNGYALSANERAALNANQQSFWGF